MRTCEATIAADPDVVFAAITDVARLPEWNAIMESVVAMPSTMEPGDEWVVEFRALGRTWRSRARLEELDPVARRFRYRAGTDDGNPSWASWRWDVTAVPEGARVKVQWDLNPTTFWRRVLLVRIRSYQLGKKEVPASLAALATHVARASTTAE